MNTLEQLYFGNSVKEWLIAFGIIVGTMLLLKIIQKSIVHRMGKFAETTKTEIDDLVVEIAGKTRFFFAFVIAVYASSQSLVLSQPASRLLQSLLILGTLLQTAIWGNTVISFVLSRAVKRRLDEDAASATTMAALGFVGRFVLWSVLLLLALDNLGINVTGLIAGLGVGGIAIALAIQNILGDLFASLSIVLDKPFVIGDFIIVDDHLGTVEHIGLKATRIRSLSGEQIVVANADLLKSRIRNFKRMYERRVVFSVGVTYQTPYEKLTSIGPMIKQIIEAQPDVRFDRVHFKQYGDWSLNYEIVYIVKSPDYNKYMDIQQAINLEIYRRFKNEDIEFAYPTQTLYMQQPSEIDLREASR